jgi:hypothetical protein
MTKSKLRQAQDDAMEVFSVRMPRALARHYRKIGRGNVSEGVRKLGEENLQGFAERRHGFTDRRKRK